MPIHNYTHDCDDDDDEYWDYTLPTPEEHAKECWEWLRDVTKYEED